MIKHVVLFKMKEYPTLQLKKEAVETFKSKLMALEGIIPELKFIEVGLNHTLEAASFDVCLITHFENLDDLKIYAVHPEHLKVGDFVKENVIDRAAVDFPF
jgi:hypothetical protein